MKRNPDYEIREIFPCGIQNQRNFCFWIQESWALQSGIHLTVGIRSPTSTDKVRNLVQNVPGIRNPRPGIRDHLESKPVLYSLTWGKFLMLVDICSGLEDSVILGNSMNYLRTLRFWLSPVARSVNSAWKRCWHASVDGWAARTFHSRCNGKGPTVTIIRVGKYIFGGYTSISWGKLKLQGDHFTTKGY